MLMCLKKIAVDLYVLCCKYLILLQLSHIINYLYLAYLLSFVFVFQFFYFFVYYFNLINEHFFFLLYTLILCLYAHQLLNYYLLFKLELYFVLVILNILESSHLLF